MVSQRVAPSASEPSRNESGTTRIASSESETTVGRIISESTMPAASKPKPVEPVVLRINGTRSVKPSQP